MRTTCLSILLLLSQFWLSSQAATPSPNNQDADAAQAIEQLDQPLYNPFIERYMLDEVKQLRQELAQQRIEFNQQLAQRELSLSDRTMTYATDTVTYFFYLIAGGSSILVLIGWTSMRDIKEKTHNMATQEVNKLVQQYEKRLKQLERQLQQKTQHIDENREAIERTQEIHSLWLKAGQDSLPANKIAIYDQILALHSNDVEALTYKADAVLELGEPQWASNLCQQALLEDPENTHAFYQLACAHTAMQQYDEAFKYLRKTLQHNERYREDIEQDPMLSALKNHPDYAQLLTTIQPHNP